MPDDRDFELRSAALDRVRHLQRRYSDLIPLGALQEGFTWRGRRVSLGSFYSGIFRPKEMTSRAALCLVTAPPKQDRPAPYEDEFDETTGRFAYRFRDPQGASLPALRAAERDNQAMVAAFTQGEPLIYFRGIAAAQYAVVAPVFITSLDETARLVRFEVALPVADTTPAGMVSDADTRAYATREAVFRLHQHRFRGAVLRAYGSWCAVCTLREASLLQAAHIIDDRDPGGHATVVNGIALCAIHHLAYDRNLMGIDPTGVVHIAQRLLEEVDGPMLRTGLQGFHGAAMLQPRRQDEQPDPARLEVRFEQFSRSAA
ncbi:MAG: HNH endonuclease [Solirubrobacteraceae bacterium]